VSHIWSMHSANDLECHRTKAGCWTLSRYCFFSRM